MKRPNLVVAMSVLTVMLVLNQLRKYRTQADDQ
jgi:hypothetical protein